MAVDIGVYRLGDHLFEEFSDCWKNGDTTVVLDFVSEAGFEDGNDMGNLPLIWEGAIL